MGERESSSAAAKISALRGLLYYPFDCSSLIAAHHAVRQRARQMLFCVASH